MHIIEAFYNKLKQPFSVKIDSRLVGQADVFIALSGSNTHGNHFLKAALEQGAQQVVGERNDFEVFEKRWWVPNTLAFLHRLAWYHRTQLADIPAIAITGSNGKTTTKNLVNAVLRQKFNTHWTKGNYNNHIGLPITACDLRSSHEFVIFEMGASKIGDIAQLCQIAKPNYGILTNIGQAHLETFGGIEGVRKGKYELADWLRRTKGTLFVHHKEESTKDLHAQSYVKTTDQIISEYDVDLRIMSDGLSLSGSICKQGIETKFKSALFGEYNIRNIEMAVALGLFFGCSVDQIAEGVSTFVPDDLRSQVIDLNGKLIVADMYNANPDSMHQAITAFLDNPNVRKPALVLGDMLELGRVSPDKHQTILNDIVHDDRIEFALVVGEHFEHAFMKLRSSKIKSLSNSDAITYLNEHEQHWQSLLIKGSRSMQLEEVLEGLKKVNQS